MNYEEANLGMFYKQRVKRGAKKMTNHGLRNRCSTTELRPELAHNPKVVGSNPTPATNEKTGSKSLASGLFV